MLDLKQIVTDTDAVTKNLKRRGADLSSTIKEIVELDGKRKAFIQKVEALKQERNQASQEIGKRKKEGKDAQDILDKMKAVATEIKGIDEKLSEVETAVTDKLLVLPNLVDASIPDGDSEEDNREERQWGNKKDFGFEPKFHYDLGEKLGVLDTKKAGEVTGARFVFLKGLAARLEWALAKFMLDEHEARGYEAILPPFIVNENALVGTGQFPKFTEDVFKLEGLKYYLVPTAEVPVTNYHRDEILDAAALPKRYVAYTPCFRSEAGSYGKDTKGIKRQHQFNKVELVKFSKPENSMEELETLVADAENILQKLELPYRVVTLCTRDTSFASTKTYDIEVWSPAAKAYMEISSCSNFKDFQARRAKIRYRDPSTKKVNFVHTLNGSGLAIGRTLIAIMENYQKEDGSFEIPDALKKLI